MSLYDLLSVLFELLFAPLVLLIVFNCSCELPHVLSESLIFECKVINFAAILIDLVSHRLISREEVQLRLNPMVLLIQEINLVLKLSYDFFICVLMVLEVELV